MEIYRRNGNGCTATKALSQTSGQVPTTDATYFSSGSIRSLRPVVVLCLMEFGLTPVGTICITFLDETEEDI